MKKTFQITTDAGVECVAIFDEASRGCCLQFSLNGLPLSLHSLPLTLLEARMLRDVFVQLFSEAERTK